MKITIHLPVTPAIKKYLDVRVGPNYKVGSEDWFGGIIISVLENKNSNKHYTLKNHREESATKEFSFLMSLSCSEKNGILILPKHEVIINNIIEDAFRRDMYVNAIINKNQYNIDYNTTFLNTLEFYDITDEEMTLDAIKRDFSRKKESIEKRMFLLPK